MCLYFYERMSAKLTMVITLQYMLSQRIWHTLNLYSAVYQWYLNKTGKKKLRSHWVRWAFTAMTAVTRRKEDLDVETEQTTGRKAREAEANGGRSWCYSATSQETPRAATPSEVRRGKKGFLPRAFQGSVVLLTPSFCTSSMQNFERRHFSEVIQFWSFVLTILGN